MILAAAYIRVSSEMQVDVGRVIKRKPPLLRGT